MRNYIILNGIKSTDINGLLIQTLPPISKPKIRTQIEEIDGRDGDIITKLGYSAYDKVFSIGLYGNYNINEVIQYFNSEGIITFSNEPDKYYKYQIINQIDFERLIRFKTANITIHCQPFKYSLVDKLKEFNINENLFSVPNYSKSQNGINLSVNNNTISITGTSTSNTEIYIPIDLKLHASSYTLKAITEGNNFSTTSIRIINEYPSNINSFGGDILDLENNSTVELAGTLEEEKQYNYLWISINAGTSINFNFNINLSEDYPLNSFSIRNNGNIYSKPKMTIYGEGTIILNLNGLDIFNIVLDDEEYIVIDIAEMEAYNNNKLMNRYVTGDYDNFNLKSGLNEINISGIISKFEIENFSRWI